jgi:hypothetical protein
MRSFLHNARPIKPEAPVTRIDLACPPYRLDQTLDGSAQKSVRVYWVCPLVTVSEVLDLASILAKTGRRL